MSTDFGIFESSLASDEERKIIAHERRHKVTDAFFAVHKRFANYLTNSSSSQEFDERFTYLLPRITEVVSLHCPPEEKIIADLRTHLRPAFSEAPRPSLPTTAMIRHSDLSTNGWGWDQESQSFKSPRTSTFNCQCGQPLKGVGQHTCTCGKIWNISSISDSNKTASTPLFVCREVLRRDVVLGSTQSFQNDVLRRVFADDTNSDPDMQDSSEPTDSDTSDAFPDLGDPSTANQDAALSTQSSRRYSFDDDFGSPTPDPTINQTPLGITEDQPAEDSGIDAAQQSILDLIVREVIEDVKGEQGNTAVQDALHDAYDALDQVKGLELLENTPIVSPVAPAPPALPAPVEASFAIREAEFERGFDYAVAERTLPEVTSQSFLQGYTTGLEFVLAESEYDQRSTDFVGTEPPIPGVSNGTDDVIPNKNPQSTDTTDELRNLLKKELDDDDNSHREMRPLDPGEMFGNRTSPTAPFSAASSKR
jgi:hypothetical protein